MRKAGRGRKRKTLLEGWDEPGTLDSAAGGFGAGRPLETVVIGVLFMG
jgi:hypothetical protein